MEELQAVVTLPILKSRQSGTTSCVGTALPPGSQGKLIANAVTQELLNT